jgi:hypothetical protein
MTLALACSGLTILDLGLEFSGASVFIELTHRDTNGG